MFIRQIKRQYKDKTYSYYLLVESIWTPRGPRQRTVCSLGTLTPGPPEQWLQLAHKLEDAITGQPSLVDEPPDPETQRLMRDVARKASRRRKTSTSQVELPPVDADIIQVDVRRVRTERCREAGPVHVGHQMWERLDLDRILASAGLDERTRVVTEAMVLNRLIKPKSEHAMPQWFRRTAIGDVAGADLDTLSDSSLYRNMDRLHPERESIEAALARREKTLFSLQDSFLLYDLTSTFFEGQATNIPKAKRGYSRDKRPDCKQLVVGLVLNGDGFPKAHEVFAGNRTDLTTVGEMLDALERRVGRNKGATVVVDRGMAFDENLKEITGRGYRYIVAARQSDRGDWLDELENEAGWEEIHRETSPRNPAQRKSRVLVKRAETAGELLALCLSDGRKAKDWAIRNKHEKKLLRDLARLQARVHHGRLRREPKIHEAIGRLKERYPRVARYYGIAFDAQSRRVTWTEVEEKKALAEKLDGSYLLRTPHKDMSPAEIWRVYMLLQLVENAFRDLKDPLSVRPIFHQKEPRAETHIFLAILALHLLVSIEKQLVQHGVHTSWETVRESLSTHQVTTTVLPTPDGWELRIRQGSAPEREHMGIYSMLAIPHQVMRPRRVWSRGSHSEEKIQKPEHLGVTGA